MNITVLNPNYFPEVADPEVLAMLQAFYSRSSQPIIERLKSFNDESNVSIKEALNKYVIGYGHSSIADCADIVIAIEGMSILATKVIQDNPLYNGQETSTRYISFEEQNIYSPIDNEILLKVQKDWVNFYSYLKPIVESYLFEEYPNTDNSKLYDKAVKARTFDIVRSFLPIGSTTQLSWKVSLRKAKERLVLMLAHPLKEIQEFAKQTLRQLHLEYPYSFTHINPKTYESDRQWRQSIIHHRFFTNQTNYSLDSSVLNYFKFKYDYIPIVDINDKSSYECFGALDFLETRVQGVEVPYYYSEFGHFKFEFQIDYGSYRDIQRHRNGVCRLPIVTDQYGFHPWYLQQLPDNIKIEAIDFIENQFDLVKNNTNGLSIIDQQYFYPLGTMVNVRCVYSLAQAIYVAELRSNSTVHPTLRQIAFQIGEAIKTTFPTIKLYIDECPDTLSLKRGSQDIMKKVDEN